MSELTDFFVRHFSLVLDNDQAAYKQVNEVIRDYFDGQDVTASQYQQMSSEAREFQFAAELGEAVMGRVAEWISEAADSVEGIAAMLIREIMLGNGSDIEYGMGVHYLPETDDAGDFLDDDEDEADDEDDNE
jgi:hypothetical protein